jgi:hypothetical protein
MSGTDETDELALRVEAAIVRLDARLRESERWRSLVAEWRRCVQLFGSGSSAARGVLLDLVRVAWWNDRILLSVYDDGDAFIGIGDPNGWAFEGDFSSQQQAFTDALESAP